jgi:hypothetical protein
MTDMAVEEIETENSMTLAATDLGDTETLGTWILPMTNTTVTEVGIEIGATMIEGAVGGLMGETGE